MSLFNRETPESRSSQKLDFLPVRKPTKNKEKVKCTGWLYKQGGYWKTWRKRYFKLRKNGLLEYYYYKEDTEPRGKIDLTVVATKPKKIPVQEGWSNYGFTVKDFLFEIVTPERTYLLCTDSHDKRDLWVNFITEVLQQTSPAYQNTPRMSFCENNNNRRNSNNQNSNPPTSLDTEDLQHLKISEEKPKLSRRDTLSAESTTDSDHEISLQEEEEKYPNTLFFSAEEPFPRSAEPSAASKKKLHVSFSLNWSDMGKTMVMRKRLLLWINFLLEKIHRLKPESPLRIANDLNDLRSGVIFAEIVMFLSDKKIQYKDSPSQVSEYCQNLNFLISFLISEHSDFPFKISADLIAAQSNHIHILNLAWAIALIYEIRTLRFNGIHSGPDALLNWINRLLPTELQIEDFSPSFFQQATLSSLLDACLDNQEGKQISLKEKIELTVKTFSLPNLVTAEDLFSGSIEEHSLLIWLSYLFRSTQRSKHNNQNNLVK